ncbi:MAG: formylmethanofuran--tetrahydromethanopterin N-formyltransferase, partial [Planctomycetales bacterium]|nr:formylmethanofuran--tetrahydromethanopterin N-formyltransferase [Planctomycetales bacterium]
DDTFAEAFPMKATRLIITAHNPTWAMHAATATTGFATSVIACGVEAGVEQWLDESDTPDGRPGAAVLLFTLSGKDIDKQVQNRVGQCVLTSPGSACFNGLESARRISLSGGPRFFGDGWQTARKLGDARYWRVPVMDGEFVIEDKAGVTTDAVGGGNFLVIGKDRVGVLETCEVAVAAIADVPDVITPFPGGIARSGSKVGSRYKGLPASTADAFCPTLKGRVETKLHPDANCAYELVIDGVDEAAVGNAMAVAMRAAVGEGVVAISAGNYGGKLGKFHFPLRPLLAESEG